MSGFILRTGMVCGGGMALPEAAWAAGPTPVQAAVQPVLVTALAFTSLVLFLIYILSRSRAAAKRFHAFPWAGPGKKSRGREISRVLEALYREHQLPMAKLSLDGTRVLEATPSLVTALGTTRAGILEKTGQDLGIFPRSSQNAAHLMDRGWAVDETPIFNRHSGKRTRCRILHFVNHSCQPPCILSLVSGLSVKPSPDQLPDFISDLLDNGTIIQ